MGKDDVMRIDRRVACGLLIAAALLVGCDVSNGAPATPRPAAPTAGSGQPQISVTAQPAPTQPAQTAPGTAYPVPAPAYPMPTSKP